MVIKSEGFHGLLQAPFHQSATRCPPSHEKMSTFFEVKAYYVVSKTGAKLALCDTSVKCEKLAPESETESLRRVFAV